MERRQIICPCIYETNAIIQLIQEYPFICAPFISKEIGNLVCCSWVCSAFFFITLGDAYVIDNFFKQYSEFFAVPDVSYVGMLLLSVLAIDTSFSGF